MDSDSWTQVIDTVANGRKRLVSEAGDSRVMTLQLVTTVCLSQIEDTRESFLPHLFESA